MAFKGADTDQLRQLAGKLKNESSTITGIISQLTSAVTSVNWQGPDATRFKNDWQSVHVPALKNVATALGDASNSATKNASQQDSASS
ncbi:WXG100 family type VII secretion target [Mycobacterium sp. M1]|uniref:WXG100 family type VII secretion target n=1 Tax=Mycolicibacter acidiphilus TaxID=2835306 RepID=A0ABS5RNK0_9MYCO|nr:WXG100 family type VII secretion target [Mycolicibacter acidiphilus]MBS9535890.1 WXG100 family type VII secretion target [Mycolicibacter acidiphilus]